MSDFPVTPRGILLDPATRQVLVSCNPKAGARSGRPAVTQLVDALQQRGFEVSVIESLAQLAADSRAAWEAGRLRAVVAAGGDGTVAEVVNRTLPGTPIAVLPLGTENLLSKHFPLPSRPDRVAQDVAQGLAVRLDAGQAAGRIFLLMVGCGFDGDVVRRLHEQRQGHIHHLSYAKPIWDAIRTYQYPELRIWCEPADTADPAEIAGACIRARWAFIVNLPRYAGGLQLMPQADGTDGRLDVCTFRDGTFWSGLKYLSGVLLGQHQAWEDCVTRRVREVRIEADMPVPYQLDGDPGGELPVDIRVLPERLTLVVPHDWIRRHGISMATPPGGASPSPLGETA